MKKILGALFLLSAGFYCEGQVTFQKAYGGGNADQGFSAQQTADGGYIIIGETYSIGAGDYDVYLIKIDSIGAMLWTKTFGGINTDYDFSVKQTTDGGYIIAGVTKSFGAGFSDVYLIKTDANGDSLWIKVIGGVSYDYGSAVQQIVDGGYIVTGLTESFSAGGSDVYLIRTDINGNTLWSKAFGGADDDYGNSVQQITNGGYIITGSTLSFGTGGEDVYLIKTDSSGNYLWSKTFGGSNDDYGSSTHQSTDGGYIIVGRTKSFGSGGEDVYLIKTDSSGNYLWSKTFGGSNNDEGNSIQLTTDGGYIIAGNTSNFGASNYFVYLIKTDANGDTLWTKTFGVNYEFANSVQLTTDGGYIITGGSLNFGVGNADVYLIKTDSLGNSGCNEGSTTTIVTAPPTQATNPATIVTSPATIVTSPTTVVGSGGIVTTLCTNVGMNEISNFQNPILISPNPSSGFLGNERQR